MTALLPTRWTFSLSTNLIHLQVDAEIQVAMESAEEDETEVLKSPLAKNKKTSNVCFCIYRPIRPSTKHQKSSFQVWCSDRVQQQLKQSSRAKFRKLREQSEKYLWNPRMCKTFDKGKVKTQLKTGLRLRLEDSICVIWLLFQNLPFDMFEKVHIL